MIVEKTVVLLNKLLGSNIIQDEDIDTDVKLYLEGLNGFKRSHAIIKLKGKEFEVYENSNVDMLYEEVVKAFGMSVEEDIEIKIDSDDLDEDDITIESDDDDEIEYSEGTFTVEEADDFLKNSERYAIWYKPTGEFVSYNDKSGKSILFTQDDTLIKEALFDILFTDGGYDGDDSDFEIRIVNASTDGSEYIKDGNMFVSPKETY